MFRLIALRILESYFRHRWLYLLPIVVMAIVAGVFVSRLEPTYVAQGIFSVQAESLVARLTSIKGTEFSWETPSSATVKEINELKQTDSFVRAVIQKTDLEAKMSGGKAVVEETLEEVRTAVWASSLGDNQVGVWANHEQPVVAYQLVNSIVDTYVQWRINADLTDSQAAFKFFTGLSEKYKVEVDAARAELYDYMNTHPQPIVGERPDIEDLEIGRLRSRLDQAISRYSQALDNIESSQLAAAQAESNTRQSYVLIDSPLVPDKPEVSRKEIALQLAIFLLVGVLLSAIGVAGAALLDRTFRFPIDISMGLNLPVLTQVPDVTPVSEKRKLFKRAKKVQQAQPPAEEGLSLSPVGELAFASAGLSEWNEVDLPLLAIVPEAPNANSTNGSRERKKKITEKSNSIALDHNRTSGGSDKAESLEPALDDAALP